MLSALPETAAQPLLSPESEAVVRATAAGLPRTPRPSPPCFYPRHVRRPPDLLRVFNQGNQANGEQSQALAASVVAYAVRLIDPTAPSFRHVFDPNRLQARLAGHHAGAVHDRRPVPDAPRSARCSVRRSPRSRGRLGRGLLAVRRAPHRRGGAALPAGRDRSGEPAPARTGSSAGSRRPRTWCRWCSNRPTASAAGDPTRPVRLGVRRPGGRRPPATAVHRLLHRVRHPLQIDVRRPGRKRRTGRAGLRSPPRPRPRRRHSRNHRAGRGFRGGFSGRSAAVGQRRRWPG